MSLVFNTKIELAFFASVREGSGRAEITKN